MILRYDFGLSVVKSHSLQTTLDQTMQNKVLVVAETGCENLSEAIARRKSEIEEVEEELDTLQATLDSLNRSPK